MRKKALITILLSLSLIGATTSQVSASDLAPVYGWGSQLDVSTPPSNFDIKYNITSVGVQLLSDLNTVLVSVNFPTGLKNDSFLTQQTPSVHVPELMLELYNPSYGYPSGNGDYNITISNVMFNGSSPISLSATGSGGQQSGRYNQQTLTNCAPKAWLNNLIPSNTLYVSFPYNCSGLPTNFGVAGYIVTDVSGGNQLAGSKNIPYSPLFINLASVIGFKQSQNLSATAPSTVYLNQGMQSIQVNNQTGTPVTFTSATPDICSFPNPNSSYLQLKTVGSCNISLQQAATNNYSASNVVTLSIQILPPLITQSITVNAPTVISLDSPQATFTATSSAGFPVSVTSEDESICTVSGNTITAVDSGECQLDFRASGSSTYSSAATNASITITPKRVAQQLYYSAPSNIHLDDQSFDLQITDDSNLPLTIKSNTPKVCAFQDPNYPSTVSLLSVGKCTFTVSQAGNNQYLPVASASASFIILPTLVGGSSSTNSGGSNSSGSTTKSAPSVNIVVGNSSATKSSFNLPSQTANSSVASKKSSSTKSTSTVKISNGLSSGLSAKSAVSKKKTPAPKSPATKS
jgi:hypothetical protein